MLQPLNGLLLQCLLWRELHKKASHFSTKWDQLTNIVPQCFAVPPILLPLFPLSYSSSCLATPLVSLYLLLHCSSYYFTTPLASLLLSVLCHSSCFITPLCASSFLLLRCSSSFFVAPLHASWFLLLFCHSSYFTSFLPASLFFYVAPLLLLRYSSLCFSTPPPTSLGCYSCLATTLCFTSMLFIVFHYYSLCFVATHCVLLLLLLRCCFVSGCCSCFTIFCCFAIAWFVITPPCFVVLLPSQIHVYPLLLHCSFVLQCCLVFCYTSTPIGNLPHPSPPFCKVLEIRIWN